MWSDACGVNSLQWIANGYEFLVLIISQLSKTRVTAGREKATANDFYETSATRGLKIDFKLIEVKFLKNFILNIE